MKKSKIALILAGAASIAMPLFGALSQEDKEAFEALGWMQAATLRSQLQSAVLAGYFTNEEGDAIEAGMVKGIQEDKPSFDPAAMDQRLQKIMADKEKAYQEKTEAETKAEKEKADNFFAELDKNPAIKKTASGLRYEIIKEGEGPKPTAKDTVKANYTGTLIDGQVFDASANHGGAIDFPLEGVIKAWTEGLQLIGKGGKIKLYAPADLAYGDAGAPPMIGPGQPLIFEVELVDIVTPPPVAETKAAEEAKPAKEAK